MDKWECHNKVLEITKKMRDLASEGSTYGNIGAIYELLGNYEKALEYYNKTLEIAQKIGNGENESIAYGYIGDVYLDHVEIMKSP